MEIACLDLEGVLIPEIWISFAEKTGIEELKLTTRDIADYDELMQMRLEVMAKHNYGINEIQEVIDSLEPLAGAVDFMDWLRRHFQVVILSDTFYEFADSIVKKLGNPTTFCHHLKVDDSGKITGYALRQDDPKRKAIKSLHNLNFRCIAAGDSYNDTSMLTEADAGILFCAPQNVIDEFPQFPAVTTYGELKEEFIKASSRNLTL
ncbi:MAG: bifunctional phosphoserine phosphatase/homoserine phosphotransferase ThrH [Deltaproteobacteria bacterium]|nr:MAG: bifunctional phosphoserine phosphatase/homoserine phosphotransferase ThrH [Deltaproteobacteria bacterium]